MIIISAEINDNDAKKKSIYRHIHTVEAPANTILFYTIPYTFQAKWNRLFVRFLFHVVLRIILRFGQQNMPYTIGQGQNVKLFTN